MKIDFQFLWLRIGVAVIFITHSVSGMFNGGINDFGTQYLDTIGFSPFGIWIAWFIKLSHLLLAIFLLLNKWLVLPIILTIFILLVGIFMVHIKSGWFVVGGGNNGVEFNFLLIFVLIQLLVNSLRINRKKISK